MATYIILSRCSSEAFADPKINLHPDAISNHHMGTCSKS